MINRIVVGVVISLLMTNSNVSFASRNAQDLTVPKYLSETYDEYKNDQQFQMMLADYGTEYALDFLEDVYQIENVQTKGGGGNVCYQYVTNVQQTKTYNCGSTTVLQTLYGLGSAGNVSGTTNSAKIATLDAAYNVDSQGSLYVYQVKDALNNYKPSWTGNYVYTLGSSITEYQFEDRISTSLTYCKPVVLHAKTGSLTYYNGKNTGHYLSLDYVNRTTDTVRIVDCNYNNAYYGIHNVPLSEAYAAVSASGRYMIY